MPTYKNSKSQSKNGGRRRKHTMRKLRRGRKSRKVMRGGENVMTYRALADKMSDFGGEFYFVFDKSWSDYLKSINKSETDTVDVDVLKSADKWKTFGPFKKAFP